MDAKEWMHQGLLFHAFFQSFNELVTARFNLVLHIKDGLTLTTPLAFEGFQVLLQAALFFEGLRQTGTALGVTNTGFGVQQGLFSSEDLVNLTLKQETTRPPGYNFLQQQDRFVRCIEGYNNDRPHQALGGKYPAEVYTPSVREYQPPVIPDYPFHDRTIRVTQCGRICIGHRKINLSTVFAGQYIGIREIADQVWLVTFMHYDLGFFDRDENRVEPVGQNPFAPKVLPMSSE